MLHLLDFVLNLAFKAVILLMGPPALLVAIAAAFHKLRDLSKPSDDESTQPVVTTQPPEPETPAKPVSDEVEETPLTLRGNLYPEKQRPEEKDIPDPLAEAPNIQPIVPQQTAAKQAQPVSEAQRKKARQTLAAAKRKKKKAEAPKTSKPPAQGKSKTQEQSKTGLSALLVSEVSKHPITESTSAIEE